MKVCGQQEIGGEINSEEKCKELQIKVISAGEGLHSLPVKSRGKTGFQRQILGPNRIARV